MSLGDCRRLLPVHGPGQGRDASPSGHLRPAHLHPPRHHTPVLVTSPPPAALGELDFGPAQGREVERNVLEGIPHDFYIPLIFHLPGQVLPAPGANGKREPLPPRPGGVRVAAVRAPAADGQVVATVRPGQIPPSLTRL